MDWYAYDIIISVQPSYSTTNDSNNTLLYFVSHFEHIIVILWWGGMETFSEILTQLKEESTKKTK